VTVICSSLPRLELLNLGRCVNITSFECGLVAPPPHNSAAGAAAVFDASLRVLNLSGLPSLLLPAASLPADSQWSPAEHLVVAPQRCCGGGLDASFPLLKELDLRGASQRCKNRNGRVRRR
ncbi:Hypothetical protein, putative, partial [Bodo saltans]